MHVELTDSESEIELLGSQSKTTVKSDRKTTVLLPDKLVDNDFDVYMQGPSNLHR